jgi:hypothetical protein
MQRKEKREKEKKMSFVGFEPYTFCYPDRCP